MKNVIVFMNKLYYDEVILDIAARKHDPIDLKGGDIMFITLQDILKKEIFDSYTVLSGEKSLHNVVDSVSILETPDFESYIVKNSLILTTYYPLRNDINKSLSLIKAMKSLGSAGIAIKIHRYIDALPEDLIQYAKEIDFPIISLDYNANLSVLFNNILTEIQVRDYSTYSIDKSYSKLLKTAYENLSTRALTAHVEKFEDFDLLIRNTETNTYHYSSKKILDLFNIFRQAKNTIKKVENMTYYSEIIIYDDKPIYQMVLLTRDDRRHLLHNYIEIFKLLIIVIYQKKMEDLLTKNEFLLNFVSSISASYTNEDLEMISKRYRWDIKFPVCLIMFSIKSKNKNTIRPNLPDQIQTMIINLFHLYDKEVKYAYINERLLFIVNTSSSLNTYDILKHIYSQLIKKHPNLHFKIIFSNNISDVNNISKAYSLISDSIIHIERNNISTSVFTQSNIELIHLLKNIDFMSLNQFLNNLLKPLITYENKTGIDLINTLYTYFACKYNARECANALFIHYNSLRHRLSIIKDLGYDLSNDADHFDLYFALYLYKNFNTH